MTLLKNKKQALSERFSGYDRKLIRETIQCVESVYYKAKNNIRFMVLESKGLNIEFLIFSKYNKRLKNIIGIHQASKKSAAQKKYPCRQHLENLFLECRKQMQED